MAKGKHKLKVSGLVVSSTQKFWVEIDPLLLVLDVKSYVLAQLRTHEGFLIESQKRGDATSTIFFERLISQLENWLDVGGNNVPSMPMLSYRLKFQPHAVTRRTLAPYLQLVVAAGITHEVDHPSFLIDVSWIQPAVFATKEAQLGARHTGEEVLGVLCEHDELVARVKAAVASMPSGGR